MRKGKESSRPEYCPLESYINNWTRILAKFVLSSRDWTGYGPHGTLDQESQKPHLYVYLMELFNSSAKEWSFVLTVKDSGDYLAQIWRPATEENWKSLVTIYDDWCIPEMFDLPQTGFPTENSCKDHFWRKNQPMPKRQKQLPSQGFCPLGNCVTSGTALLAKFVPGGSAWTGYGPHGLLLEGQHFYVELSVNFDGRWNEWVFILNVMDSDDFIAQIRKPATEENWRLLVKIYDDLSITGLTRLEAVGFEW